ncbi:DUF397 domain-containing protein [Streptomyces aidingensis]|uniref:DUF397 domain-containing protein n=1 Tax=Streptomyces aidingensis TaxID=910347 RepID=A0A1I1GKW7_9ACTN|nr:DUF397 domain-containing protein [Streptomyces aidingensis]SFC12419.1 protein of unknown function [Streptomyces aidingensis]
MTHADLPETPDWTSSTYSQSNGGECIEWAPKHAAAHGVVPVRDSKDPRGPHLSVSPVGWAGFVAAVKNGDLGTA